MLVGCECLFCFLRPHLGFVEDVAADPAGFLLVFVRYVLLECEGYSHGSSAFAVGESVRALAEHSSEAVVADGTVFQDLLRDFGYGGHRFFLSSSFRMTVIVWSACMTLGPAEILLRSFIISSSSWVKFM